MTEESEEALGTAKLPSRREEDFSAVGSVHIQHPTSITSSLSSRPKKEQFRFELESKLKDKGLKSGSFPTQHIKNASQESCDEQFRHVKSKFRAVKPTLIPQSRKFISMSRSTVSGDGRS